MIAGIVSIAKQRAPFILAIIVSIISIIFSSIIILENNLKFNNICSSPILFGYMNFATHLLHIFLWLIVNFYVFCIVKKCLRYDTTLGLFSHMIGYGFLIMLYLTDIIGIYYFTICGNDIDQWNTSHNKKIISYVKYIFIENLLFAIFYSAMLLSLKPWKNRVCCQEISIAYEHV